MSIQLAHELTRMHTQLQKFSVALEQMSEDNRKDDPLRHNALSKTKNYVKMVSTRGAARRCSDFQRHRLTIATTD